MYETSLAGLVNMEEMRQSTKHRYNLKTRFDIVKSLGHGTYGKVKLAIDKKTGQKVSVAYTTVQVYITHETWMCKNVIFMFGLSSCI